MTNSALASSAEVAIAALEPARRIYTHFGYNSSIEALLVEKLTEIPQDSTPEETVEEVIQLLWSYFPGGSTAVVVTSKILRELGRDDLAEL